MTKEIQQDSKSTQHSFLAALPLSDAKVTVRVMVFGDAEAYSAGTDDQLVRQFAHLPLQKYTPEIVRDLIEGAIAEGLRAGTLAVLTVADTASDQFLGSLVFFDITSDEAEVGYWISPAHRGQKVASRALNLAREIGRKLGLATLRARTVEGNAISERVLLNAGFKPAGVAQADTTPSGKTQMTVNYRLELPV